MEPTIIEEALYAVRCGNCGITVHDTNLSALLLRMHEHWSDHHGSNIHLPRAVAVTF